MTPLRRRMIEDMRIRNLAPNTQRTYVEQVSRFARHFGRSPELLGPADIRTYQLHLIQERQLSASSLMVAVAAIRFFYKVTLKRDWRVEEVVPTCRKPQRLPVVLRTYLTRQYHVRFPSVRHETDEWEAAAKAGPR
jgi:site-specific recombinase XerD